MAAIIGYRRDMTLYCLACLQQKRSTEAYTIMRGYALCFDHVEQILADRRMSHPSLDGSAFRRDLARIVGRD